MRNKSKSVDATIIDLLASESRFKKFNEAIHLAGLAEKFSGSTSFTIFAPTDDAFAKLPRDKTVNLLKPENREQLKTLLLLHMVPGTLRAEDLKNIRALTTAAGQEIKVAVSKDLSDIKLANAKVILPTAETRDGYVYPLDAVLQPLTRLAAAS